MIGRTLSHYRVLERLGSGGTGEVFLAEDLRLHRPVALKLLRGEDPGTEPLRQRLLREARAASALNHPNIAVIYEIDDAELDGRRFAFLAMEYVPGETLADWARNNQPSLGERLELVQQVIGALSHAHERGIVHRDVKPSNLVVACCRVKVLDFGLATQVPFGTDDVSTWSREPAGVVVGTVAYMAPEQALGRPVDARCDQFALGVVLYELLAGRAPFTGENAVATLDAILHAEPPPLALHFADPRAPQLDRVIRRMLAKSRDQRFPSLAAAGAALQAVVADEPPQPVAPATSAIAVLPFANLTAHPEDDWLGAGVAETVSTDLRSLSTLEVVARQKVEEVLRHFGDAERDDALALRVARELGARWVITGGVQRLGDDVRLTARLLDGTSGAVARAARLDGPVSNIFKLQDQLVQALTAGLRAGLRGEQAAPSAADETPVIAAYEALAKGLLNLRSESYEALDRAVLFFERATVLDSGYARAHLELGTALSSKGEYLSAPELHARAVASLLRALELKPGSARAWRELGAALVSAGRIDEGVARLEQALALAPEDPMVLAGMARALFLGRADFAGAARYFERALEHSPHAGWYWLQLAHCCALLRDFARGERAAQRAVRLQQEFLSGREGSPIVGAWMRLGHLAMLAGRPPEALAHFQQELAFLQRVEHALRGRITIELHLRLGAARRALGHESEAAADFATARDAYERRVALGADDPFTRFYAAGAHAMRGETDSALSLLERAAAERPAFTAARLAIEPEFVHLRAEPRAQDLIARYAAAASDLVDARPPAT